jgi:hypothetical protein
MRVREFTSKFKLNCIGGGEITQKTHNVKYISICIYIYLYYNSQIRSMSCLVLSCPVQYRRSNGSIMCTNLYSLGLCDEDRGSANVRATLHIQHRRPNDWSDQTQYWYNYSLGQCARVLVSARAVLNRGGQTVPRNREAQKRSRSARTSARTSAKRESTGM